MCSGLLVSESLCAPVHCAVLSGLLGLHARADCQHSATHSACKPDCESDGVVAGMVEVVTHSGEALKQCSCASGMTKDMLACRQAELTCCCGMPDSLHAQQRQAHHCLGCAR